MGVPEGCRFWLWWLLMRRVCAARQRTGGASGRSWRGDVRVEPSQPSGDPVDVVGDDLLQGAEVVHAEGVEVLGGDGLSVGDGLDEADDVGRQVRCLAAGAEPVDV